MAQFFFRQTSVTQEFQTPLSLLELHQQIREELELAFPDSYWVVAEISQVNPDRRSGHCYLNLVDKGDNARGAIQAQARATIWSSRFQMLGRYFEEKTGQPLKAGLKILFQTQVRFHELYGLSLDILNIDANYTIGDLARQRQETLKRLEAEGLLTANQELEMPLVPQRLAVISSATAAGYQDFIHQLEHNSYGYTFDTRLFPAIVQGNEAPASIARAMQLIAGYSHLFDAIVLIRGGGSQTDLACFDDYQVAAAIGHSPLPVLTGIGHERDESIADLVAHTRQKTPTAVANYLIDRAQALERRVEDLFDSIHTFAAQQLRLLTDSLERQSLKVTNLTNAYLQERRELLEHFSRSLLLKPKSFLQHQQDRLQQSERLLQASTKDVLHLRGKQLADLTVCVESIGQRWVYLKGQDLGKLTHCIETEAKDKLKHRQLAFTKCTSRLQYSAQRKLSNDAHRLDLLEMRIQSNDPEKLLLRGYTLTLLNGKIIKHLGQVKEGDVIETRLQDGRLHSIVVNTDKDE